MFVLKLSGIQRYLYIYFVLKKTKNKYLKAKSLPTTTNTFSLDYIFIVKNKLNGRI